MPKLQLLLAFLFSLPLAGQSQTGFELSPPLDIPMVLSGTFGELRSNHFHAGIDIKTQGRSGLVVRSAAAGYVSRVAVSPYGYGNAIYVRHPEGYTTVYAHLQSFEPALEKWVEEQLRTRSKNRGNLYPNKYQFTVDRGQLIGYSGNSGGSMGPHLHFEIRDSKSEEPLNPFLYGIKIKDTRKPLIGGIGFVREETRSRGNLHSGDTIYSLNERIGIEVYTIDKLNGAENKNGVYKIECLIDGKLYYQLTYDRLNFSTTKYINAHINYSRYDESGKRWTRLYTLPNNSLKIHTPTNLFSKEFSANNGYLQIHNGLHKVTVKVHDYSNNTEEATLWIQHKLPYMAAPIDKIHAWNAPLQLGDSLTTFSLPAGALYQDEAISFNRLKSGQVRIGNSGIKAHKSFTIYQVLPNSNPGYYLEWNNGKGKTSALTGDVVNGKLEVKTSRMGLFMLRQDVSKPVVSLVQSVPFNRPNSAYREIRIKAQDKDTGVERYSARIDGEFARIDFDYKRDLLKVVIPEHIEAGKHNLQIIVIDGVGRTTTANFTIEI